MSKTISRITVTIGISVLIYLCVGYVANVEQIANAADRNPVSLLPLGAGLHTSSSVNSPINDYKLLS